jgi:hypothetical protein
MSALFPVMDRLKNKVEKDDARAKGKTFDDAEKPTDVRFIGRQVDAVRCICLQLAIMASRSALCTHWSNLPPFISQFLLNFCLASTVIWSFFESQPPSSLQFGHSSAIFGLFLATELVLHYVRQYMTLACRFTISTEDIGKLLALAGDYACLLHMFGWRCGANETQFAFVMAHFLNKVTAARW